LQPNSQPAPKGKTRNGPHQRVFFSSMECMAMIIVQPAGMPVPVLSCGPHCPKNHQLAHFLNFYFRFYRCLSPMS
jgi:hypothetical protein